MSSGPWFFVTDACWSCGRMFTFNPYRVPSIPVTPGGTIAHGGDRKPICRDCATRANARRLASGLPLWDVSDEAYEPVEGFPG